MDVSKLLAMAEKTRADISARSGGFNRAVRPPMGQSRWRILPPWRKDSGLLHRTFGQHFIKDAAGKVIGATVCLSASAEEVGSVSCKFCDELNAMKRLVKDDASLEALREFNAGENYLFNAVRTDGTAEERKKVVLLSMPKSLSNDFYTLLATYAAEGVVVVDPNVGRDIIITREGTKFNTKYSMTPALKESAVPKEILDNIINIDEYIEGEIKRGRSSEAKFAPALGATARRIGIPSADIASALSGEAFSVSGPRVESISAPKAEEDLRVISGEMPWDEDATDAISTPKTDKKSEADIEADALAEFEEPASRATPDKGSTKVEKEKALDDDIEGILADL